MRFTGSHPLWLAAIKQVVIRAVPYRQTFMAALAAPASAGEDSALAKEMDACVDALSPLLQRVHDFLARSPARATAAAAQI